MAPTTPIPIMAHRIRLPSVTDFLVVASWKAVGVDRLQVQSRKGGGLLDAVHNPHAITWVIAAVRQPQMLGPYPLIHHDRAAALMRYEISGPKAHDC